MSAKNITNGEIYKIALANGFTTRRQEGGHIDLNPYVYEFARALLKYEEDKAFDITAPQDPSKPVLSLDFDGVLHKYNSGWEGADVIADDPVDGAMRFLTDAVEKFNVHIFSTRSHQVGGVEAMWSWIRNHLHVYWEDMPEVADKVLARISFPKFKPPANVLIDDRALCFMGDWPDLDEVLTFKPWNKR